MRAVGSPDHYARRAAGIRDGKRVYLAGAQAYC